MGEGFVNRKTYVDLVKVFAILGVIYNHIPGAFCSFQNNSNLILNVIQIFLSILCKAGVPLFLMCSGALLLEKQRSVSSLMKRIIKYIAILIGFTLLYYLMLCIVENSTFDLRWILPYMYSNRTFGYSGAYWFLYAYIGFLVISPMLCAIVNHLSDELLLYFQFVIVLIYFAIPLFERVFQVGPLAIDIPILYSEFCIYPMIGYLIDKEKILKSKRSFIILNVLGIIIMGLNIMVSYKSISANAFDESKLSYLGVILYATIFVNLKHLGSVIQSESLKGVLQKVGQVVLGIYLSHVFVLYMFDVIIAKYNISLSYWMCLVETGLVFLIGWMLATVVAFLRKVVKIR